jgi:hypothetical protein
MKKIYFLRGQVSGVDHSLAFASVPSEYVIARHAKHENEMHGPNKDGSPRWVRAFETALLLDAPLEEFELPPEEVPTVDDLKRELSFRFSGTGEVVNP